MNLIFTLTETWEIRICMRYEKFHPSKGDGGQQMQECEC